MAQLSMIERALFEIVKAIGLIGIIYVGLFQKEYAMILAGVFILLMVRIWEDQNANR